MDKQVAQVDNYIFRPKKCIKMQTSGHKNVNKIFSFFLLDFYKEC